MAETTGKFDSRRVARERTASLRDMLRGKIAWDTTALDPEPPAATTTSGTKPLGRRKKKPIPLIGNRPNPLRSVGDRLQRPKTRLAKLLAQVNELVGINRIFHAYLAPHLRQHATLIALETDKWTVQTDSPAWATRLRYTLPSLRKHLTEKLGTEVPPLRIRISPATLEPPRLPPRRLQLSAQAGDLLEKTAHSLDDRHLGAALLRLARNARRNDP
jgi:hypothetical protein